MMEGTVEESTNPLLSMISVLESFFLRSVEKMPEIKADVQKLLKEVIPMLRKLTSSLSPEQVQEVNNQYRDLLLVNFKTM